MKRITAIILVFCYGFVSYAQGHFTGDLQHAFNVHIRDENIGAANNQLYDNFKSSSDTWMNLRYRNNGFEFGMRYDMFLNSISFAGENEVNGIGLGYWYAKTRIDKLGKSQLKGLTITAGHFYDQLGSGTTFRAFENRGLGFDNALVGLKAELELPWNLNLKAFTGRQKNMRGFLNGENAFLNVYKPAIAGIGLEGFYNLTKKNKEKAINISVAPGISFVNRIVDSDFMNTVLVPTINSYDLENRFVPKYNTFVFSAYNTFSLGRFALYTEFAGKSKDNILINTFNVGDDGSQSLERRLALKRGYVAFGSLTYSQKGLGISLQAKKTSFFGFRTQSLGLLENDGVINFLPAQTRQNSLRLLSRYNHNTQELDELSFQVDVTYTPKRGITFNANFADVRNNDERLYREYYLEATIKPRKKKWKLITGIQAQDYNQNAYEKDVFRRGKLLTTFTPFVDFTWKFDRKKSIRVEAQYLLTKRNETLFGATDANPTKEQDLGDWAHGLVEFTVAPNWTFSVGNTVNLNNEEKILDDGTKTTKLDVTHFPIVYTSYTIKTTRLELSYAKMNEGIICTGGVCRFQPAFSGVRFGMTTSF